MARSRALAAAVIALLGGCDLVFDVQRESTPCELGSFAEVPPLDLTRAEEFSIDWDMTFAVTTLEGMSYEVDLETRTSMPIDLGLYSPISLALAPEGRSMFYTASAEPNLLKGALRSAATEWVLEATTPRGTFAGTPSADVFGPRRVLVKERDVAAEIQEYEDISGHWVPIGSPHPLSTDHAPNLTPNGLTMVYVEPDPLGVPMVRAAQRASISEWFGPPTTLREGQYRSPQLLGECKRLYLVEDTTLRQFDR
jgi:hypothetical protein